MANPVCARTKSASVRPIYPPVSSLIIFSLTRFVPLVMTKTALPEIFSLDIIDFTNCTTSPSIDVAASTAVRIV